MIVDINWPCVWCGKLMFIKQLACIPWEYIGTMVMKNTDEIHVCMFALIEVSTCLLGWASLFLECELYSTKVRKKSSGN